MAEFKKTWRNSYDKQTYTENSIINFPHNVNDPNSSHYLKAETYTRDEMEALFEPIISGIGTTEQYYRGDRTWADFNTKARAAFSASYPLTYTSGTGNFTLGYNTTNLQVSSNLINTIQNINSTATPQFAKIGLGKTPTAVLDITSTGTSANEGLALTNTNSEYTWKMWMGTPGNYDGYLKFGLDPTTQNDFLAHFYKNTGGCFSVTERLIAPYHCSPMTGYGDYNLVGWVNTGGNFNGYAFLSADTGNTGSSSADARIVMGLNTSSKISFMTSSTELAWFTQPGIFTVKNNIVQQPQGGSSLTLSSGTTITGSSNLNLDTVVTTGGDILIRPRATTAMTIKNDGNVGIGFTSPSSKLSINGGLHIGGEHDAGDKNLVVDGKAGFNTATLTEVMNLNGNLKHTGNYSFYNNFTSGWTGTGWRLDYGVTNANVGTLELDDLWVRGTMSVYELLINQIRATNGSLFVTSSARVSGYVEADPEIITFEDVTGHGVTPFAVDDLIMCQRVSLDSLTVIKRVVREIITISGLTAEVQPTTGGPSDTGTIEPGDDFVRIGNLGEYPNRQGTVYLTADDSNAPYIDILNDVASWADWTSLSKNKGRIGRLSGISTSPFGQLDGYGIYSQNIYLTGNANIWGTITTGDAYGFEPTFYAGRMGKNLFKISENALANDTGYAFWIWNSGSSYTNDIISSTGPGGLSVQATKIRRSSASGSIAAIIDGATSRCWVGDQGEFDGKTWTVSFWVRSIGTATSTTYTWAVDYPDGTQLYTKDYTQENGVWQKLTFVIDATTGGGYPKISTLDLVYHATHYLEFYGFQIEEGGTATIYQPTDGGPTPSTEFGMWAIKGGFGGTITNPRISLKDSGLVVRKDSSGSATWLGTDTISIGYTANEWGIIGKSSTSKVFELGSTNKIAGWTFTSTVFQSPSSKITLDSSNNTIEIYNSGATGSTIKYVNLGKTRTTDGEGGSVYTTYYGISATGEDGSTAFRIDDNTKVIAGWTFDTYKFTKGTATTGFSLNTSSTPFITGNSSKGFEIYDSSNIKIFAGLRDSSGNLDKGFDWNITTSNVFTMKGEILASKFSTTNSFSGITEGVIVNGGAIGVYKDNDSSYNYKLNMTGKGVALLYSSDSSFSTVAVELFSSQSLGSMIEIESKNVGKYHGESGSAPTTNVREGDTYYNSGNSRLYFYANSSWIQIN